MAPNNFLEFIRKQNKLIASVCHICKKQSTGINCIKHRVIYVCDEHKEPENPHVVHRIYPEGLSISKTMMDPNIGGFIPKKEK